MAQKIKLGEALVKAGLIDELQLKSALGHQTRWGGRLGKCLVELKFLGEDKLIRFLSETYSYPAVDLSRSKLTMKVLKLIPRKVAEKYGVIPVMLKPTEPKKTLVVAMSDPMDIQLIDELTFLTNLHIEAVVALDSAIQQVINQWGSEDIHIDTKDLVSFGAEVDDYGKEDTDIEHMELASITSVQTSEEDSGIELIHDEMEMVQYVKETTADERPPKNTARDEDSKIEFDEFKEFDEKPEGKTGDDFGQKIADFDEIMKKTDGKAPESPRPSEEFRADQTMIMMTEELTGPPKESLEPAVKPLEKAKEPPKESPEPVVEPPEKAKEPPKESPEPVVKPPEEAKKSAKKKEEEPKKKKAKEKPEKKKKKGKQKSEEAPKQPPKSSSAAEFTMPLSLSDKQAPEAEIIEAAEVIESEQTGPPIEAAVDPPSPEQTDPPHLSISVAVDAEDFMASQKTEEEIAEAEEVNDSESEEYVAEAIPEEDIPTAQELIEAQLSPDELISQVAEVKATVNELRAKIDNFLMLFLMRESGQITTEEFLDEIKKG